MDTEGTSFAAVAVTTIFLHYFSGLPDHRQASNVDYPLPEVLLLILLAVLAGAEAFTDIARFGERKIELLRRFRPYVNGTPSHDHLGDIFATLDARAFQLCFVAWVAALERVGCEQPERHEGDADDGDPAGEPRQHHHAGDDRRRA